MPAPVMESPRMRRAAALPAAGRRLERDVSDMLLHRKDGQAGRYPPEDGRAAPWTGR